MAVFGSPPTVSMHVVGMVRPTYSMQSQGSKSARSQASAASDQNSKAPSGNSFSSLRFSCGWRPRKFINHGDAGDASYLCYRYCAAVQNVLTRCHGQEPLKTL